MIDLEDVGEGPEADPKVLELLKEYEKVMEDHRYRLDSLKEIAGLSNCYSRLLQYIEDKIAKVRQQDLQTALATEHRRIIEARQDECFEAWSAHNNEEDDYWERREEELNELLTGQGE